MNTSAVEQQLIDAGFARLFLYGNQRPADEIWQNGTHKDALEQVISTSSDNYAKFLAAELLRLYQVPLQRGVWGILAETYTEALQETGAGNRYQLNGNMWGFLSRLNDAGILGRQLIDFGEQAIPFLTGLLNDDHIIYYDGSQEATLGNELQYRVKDFAAFYISKIRNIPLHLGESHAQRDEAIEQLKNAL